jgi:hypothetical protein
MGGVSGVAPLIPGTWGHMEISGEFQALSLLHEQGKSPSFFQFGTMRVSSWDQGGSGGKNICCSVKLNSVCLASSPQPAAIPTEPPQNEFS